jgi:hypothetical protein
VNINLTLIKQTLKSRLTTCQLILLVLIIAGILTFVLVIVFLRKPPCSVPNSTYSSKYLRSSIDNLAFLFRRLNS